jgi:hypothetical protein
MATERTTFQKLAQVRIDEANTLLAHRQPSGAYYLAGYAIECALKAVIAKQFRADEIPDRNLVKNIYQHDLAALLSLAELEKQLEIDRQTDPELDRRWSIVKNWTEQARYALWTEEESKAILNAVDGVFQWLSARW